MKSCSLQGHSIRDGDVIIFQGYNRQKSTEERLYWADLTGEGILARSDEFKEFHDGKLFSFFLHRPSRKTLTF